MRCYQPTTVLRVPSAISVDHTLQEKTITPKNEVETQNGL
jgi:hypothetical protein